MSVCKRVAKSPVREKRTRESMSRYSLLVSILAIGLFACGTVEDKKMLTSIKRGEIKVVACKKSINLIDCENPKKWTGKVLLNKKVKLGSVSLYDILNSPEYAALKQGIRFSLFLSKNGNVDKTTNNQELANENMEIAA